MIEIAGLVFCAVCMAWLITHGLLEAPLQEVSVPNVSESPNLKVECSRGSQPHELGKNCLSSVN